MMQRGRRRDPDGPEVLVVGGGFAGMSALPVLARSDARVTLLDRNNNVILHLGDDSAANTWKDLRKEPRDKFIAGKSICPHGATFDHAGNIFVVEWVEVGRVSKMRRVA